MQLQSKSRIVNAWLILCLIALSAIIVIDGTVRRYESGFSITEWEPIRSMVPLTSDTAIEQEFEVYKRLPQFQKNFPNMGLEEFRTIYFFEYMDYVLGYVFILLTIVPFLIFTLAKVLHWSDALKLCLVFSCGGAQYISHYYVAKYSLFDDPHFIPYRISLQLALQFIFFGLILWQVLTFTYPRQGIGGFELPKPTLAFKILSCITLAAIFIQITLGGAVSGLHAGLNFNTFPRMDMAWVPEGLWPIPEWYKNLFEDATTAQFIHRMIAYGLSLLIPLFWLFGRNNPHIAHLLPILFSIFVVEFLLGVLTLLFAVPIPIASLHHANAILVFGIAVTIVHRLFIPIKTIYYDIVIGTI